MKWSKPDWQWNSNHQKNYWKVVGKFCFASVEQLLKIVLDKLLGLFSQTTDCVVCI